MANRHREHGHRSSTRFPDSTHSRRRNRDNYFGANGPVLIPEEEAQDIVGVGANAEHGHRSTDTPDVDSMSHDNSDPTFGIAYSSSADGAYPATTSDERNTVNDLPYASAGYSANPTSAQQQEGFHEAAEDEGFDHDGEMYLTQSSSANHWHTDIMSTQAAETRTDFASSALSQAYATADGYPPTTFASGDGSLYGSQMTYVPIDTSYSPYDTAQLSSPPAVETSDAHCYHHVPGPSDGSHQVQDIRDQRSRTGSGDSGYPWSTQAHIGSDLDPSEQAIHNDPALRVGEDQAQYTDFEWFNEEEGPWSTENRRTDRGSYRHSNC
ncbi:hypothetical protein F5B20DRAFT_583237 [Whalleya microplaca]|nr:hypothetical protein F5B20DRAFT_583237 [Whalleya microplaca]